MYIYKFARAAIYFRNRAKSAATFGAIWKYNTAYSQACRALRAAIRYTITHTIPAALAAILAALAIPTLAAFANGIVEILFK